MPGLTPRRPRFLRPYGPEALLLEWEARIDPEINRSVHHYAGLLARLPAVVECVPAYASLLIVFHRDRTTAYRLREVIYDLGSTAGEVAPGRLHRLPVCYGETHGPDLFGVSLATGLPPDRIAELHAGREYTAFFLGYRPGFAFLGTTDARLHVSRLETPRSRVEPGAVGLAGSQTGIYPTPAPGGWQLIGRCPLPVISAGPEFARIQPGDRVRFYPIDAAEFTRLQNDPPPWPDV